MLTSKLILMSLTWVLALLVSISLRAGGIVHPNSFHINHFLVWCLVFSPSLFLLIYFLVKKSFSSNPSI
ncbi:MAG: hypothetical protein CMK48_01875 [Prochlorococcus sp. MED630]|nr:hypothetical protein [Prochlorococcus sp. MED630]